MDNRTKAVVASGIGCALLITSGIYIFILRGENARLNTTNETLLFEKNDLYARLKGQVSEPEQVTSLTGKVTEVRSDAFVIEIDSFVDLPPRASEPWPKETRTITFDKDTAFVRFGYTCARDGELLEEETIIAPRDIFVGDEITAVSGENIRNAATFKAVKISREGRAAQEQG